MSAGIAMAEPPPADAALSAGGFEALYRTTVDDLYATVDVTVTAARRSAAATGSSDSRFTPAAAWRDARRGLEIAAGVAIIALAMGLPLGLAAALATAGVGTLRRRRREAALDAA